jgi:predicted esterase
MERADTIAGKSGWIRQQIATPGFTLRAYHTSYLTGHKELAVYIEGDGVAWVTPTVISSDPTPDTPLTLELAVQDPTPNRLYLARPCQYASESELSRCNPAFWTSHRYAPEVVESLNAAIDQSKRESSAQSLYLFGYSGGGNLAVLLAARRTDVAKVVTIAGNIDHAAWTTLHGDTPLFGSLNAAAEADATSGIPQIHFSGAKDDTVPASIAASYRNRARDRSHIAVVSVAGADHQCCWVQKWQQLLRQYVYR